MLSDEQKRFYETFGFLVLRQLFSSDEMAEIRREFDDVLEEALGGNAFTGRARHMVLGCVERRPGLARLIEDDRLFGAVEDLLGPDLVWITSDGNYYVGDTQWHPDAGGLLPSYHLIKIALYLDPVRADSGCLRVIPGSHREPFHGTLRALSGTASNRQPTHSASTARTFQPIRSNRTRATSSSFTRRCGTPRLVGASSAGCSR
jgi:ectoine hydroxylase-related dioxygenase (phytanoyl-CoA dioxygenase family)